MTTTETRPTYIGVTGFMKGSEAKEILNHPELTFGPDDPKLMVGVLASSATLRGEKGKWPGRYPAIEAIDGIFPRHPRAFNLIHYATREPKTLGDQLIELVRRVDSTALHGFQLNVAWPIVGQLEKLCDATGRWNNVLQVGSTAFQLVNKDPKKLALRVASYGGLISHVLLDLSGGTGAALNREIIDPFLDELYERLPPTFGIGVAGGLGPISTDLARRSLNHHPDVSVDAENELRDRADDSLVVSRAVEYVRKMRHQYEMARYMHSLR